MKKVLLSRWINESKSIISLWQGDHGGFHIVLDARGHKHKNIFVTQIFNAMVGVDSLMDEFGGPWIPVEQE